MARGFHTTLGVASTDRIQTSLTAHAVCRTYAAWTYSRSHTNASIFDKSDAGVQLERIQDSGAGVGIDGYEYKRAWSTSSGGLAVWYSPWPAFGAWIHVAMTYDGSSASNAPLIYYNGISQAVTTFTAASGTIGTNTDSYWIGNRGNGDRGWDGKLAEAAIWDRILSPVQIRLLAGGWSPLLFRAALVEYIPLDGTVESKVRGPWKPVTTGTRWQPHPLGTIKPTRFRPYFLDVLPGPLMAQICM